MNKRFFITGTGTGIGKSFVAAAMVRQTRALGQSVMAYKPVVTGVEPSPSQSLTKVSDWAPPSPAMRERDNEDDTSLLLHALGLQPTPENIARISPWRFKAPLAPSMAARIEKKMLDFDALIAHGKKSINGPGDIVLIEGVGGVMVPLDDTHTVLDWMQTLGIPVLLVTGSYLGALSHTLTALAVLEQKQVPVHALIVNESANSSVDLDETTAELKRWVKVPVVTVRRNDADGLRVFFS